MAFPERTDSLLYFDGHLVCDLCDPLLDDARCDSKRNWLRKCILFSSKSLRLEKRDIALWLY